MPVAVQDVNADVNLYDVFLDLVVHFVVPIFDVVLLPEDVEVVLAIFVVVFLVDDVDKVDGQVDADVLGFHTVLDVQGEVEVVLCELLYDVL